jgi:hypothetical protein
MQHTAGPQNSVEFTRNKPMVPDVFKYFEANDFVEGPILTRQVVEIAVLKR